MSRSRSRSCACSRVFRRADQSGDLGASLYESKVVSRAPPPAMPMAPPRPSVPRRLAGSLSLTVWSGSKKTIRELGYGGRVADGTRGTRDLERPSMFD